MMNIEDYNYELPKELIAQVPLANRSSDLFEVFFVEASRRHRWGTQSDATRHERLFSIEWNRIFVDRYVYRI